MKTLNRIAELRKDRKWTQDDLAEALNTHRVTVARLETGKIRLNTDWLRLLAKVFNVAPHLILLKSETMGETVEVSGVAQPGAWTASAQWPEKERYIITIPHDPEWSGIEKCAHEVRGTAMNLLYPDRSVIIWVPFATRPEQLKHGRRYVIERQRDGEFEVSVKEYVKDTAGREWLETRSSDPSKQERVPLRPAKGEALRVLGRVISSYRKEEP